ncbi:MotA/TolQ/ExbB proton channel family protein [uncultured Pseudodesulfovibrio sp.]|uniref:MotA/TolQ/ExbB proton channel family protein n=1 Tax=uncultured Pseudodesulfovibrio sp. TaxID=2035858 RepID=UPI0029C6AEBC|nr:MotA/TolQ/ExbB proton channel family protein [uncultured Pseudodesulfovibrio sp.]
MFIELFNHLREGGIIMLPIGVLALTLWWLVFLKARELLTLIRQERTLQEVLTYSGDDWQSAIAKDYLASRSGNEELDVEVARVLVDRHAGHTKKGISTILILAATAPLLGLLGTVTGMVNTFEVIAQFGTGNAKGLAAGISQALITTQSGLIVAVPGMVAGSLLYRRAAKLKDRMVLFLSDVERVAVGKEVLA